MLENLTNKNVYFTGIKGTGMSALAELLHNAGARVSGSDTSDVFYTDAILKELSIPYFGFDAANITSDIDLVVYSAAYPPDTHPELLEAKRLKIPILKYTEALGEYSALFDSSGIAGVHGKTTTTAMTGALLKGTGLSAQILAGSAVSSFGGHSTLTCGPNPKYFVAETCEYRRHFLSFHPRRIVLTSVESDHQDYYPTYNDIRDAFVEYGRKLPQGGELIFCADDKGAFEVADILKNENLGIIFTPYGWTAEGDFKITSSEIHDETMSFTLEGFPSPFVLKVPGKHSVLDATAALALTSSLVKAESGVKTGGWKEKQYSGVRKALEKFRGSKRRSEIIGEAGGILFMDDYGHHPTAIRTTIEGIKAFYPKRRLVVSFMSHTYTRTAALLDEFAASLQWADIVILHKIYASAREIYEGGITGETLFEKTCAVRDNVYYVDEPLDAIPLLNTMLRSGDLFLTLGAGDNWRLGRALLKMM
jgi:UDP-N-acetylmuramate--alanine ligase